MITEILDFLAGTNDFAVAIRLLIAALFGSLIGWERIIRRHSAGIKTFTLVSLGSAVATALNIYLANLPGLSADVSRIPAGVVSGIGFLGAGTILVTGRKQIKGLTTAASLWVASCMGMAIGAGYVVVGTICFILVMISNIILYQFSGVVESHSKYMSIYIEVEKDQGVTRLSRLMYGEGYEILSLTKSKEKPLLSTDVALIMDLQLKKGMAHSDIIKMLSEQEFVNYIEEI